MNIQQILAQIIESLSETQDEKKQAILEELISLAQDNSRATPERLQTLARELISCWISCDKITDILDKATMAGEIRKQFLALAAIPDMLQYFANQSALRKCIVDHINQMPMQETMYGFCSVIFGILWAENNSQKISNHRSVIDFLMCLKPFADLQFLSLAEADTNLSKFFRANNLEFWDIIFEANKKLQHRPLYTALTQYGGYSMTITLPQYKAVNDIVTRLLAEEDFHLMAYYANADETFKQLPQVIECTKTIESQTSLYLTRLFDKDAIKDDLSGNKWESLKNLHADTLIAELTTRYREALNRFAKSLVSDIDHKRMKRLMEDLNHFSLEEFTDTQRETLAQSRFPIAVLQCGIDTYSHTTTLQYFKGKGKSNDKAAFLRFIRQNYENRIVFNEQNQDALTLDLPNIPTETESVMWKAYVAVTDKTPASIQVVNHWLRDTILHGIETRMLLSWLPNAYLEYIAQCSDLVELLSGTALKNNVARNSADAKTANDNSNQVVKNTDDFFTKDVSPRADRYASIRCSIVLAVQRVQHEEQLELDSKRKSVFGKFTVTGGNATNVANNSTSSGKKSMVL